MPRRRVTTVRRRRRRKATATRRVAVRGVGTRRVRVTRRRRLVGRGFFNSLWSGIKSVGSFIKDNKLISRGLSLIPHAGAQTAGNIAGQLGLGRKRRIRRRILRTGSGIMPNVFSYARVAPSRRLAPTTMLPGVMTGQAAHTLRL